MCHAKTMWIAAAALALGLGCGKKDEGDKGDKGGGGATADKGGGEADKGGGDPNVWKDLEIPKVGLIAHVPGDAKVGSMGSIATPDYKCSLSVYPKGAASSSFENWVTNIEKGNKGGPLKEMIKKEKTDDDNFVLQWTTEKKFGYVARKTIGDKVVTCINFQASSQEKLDCTIKMCESLKAK